MSAAFWDTELGKGGGGGAEPQQLVLNGYTLSLVPDGGTVQLPLGAISTLGPAIVVSSLTARDRIVVGPASNVFITSTGVVNATTVAVQLANATNVNATTTTTTNINATQGNISTLLASNANMLQVNANSISSGMAAISSMRAGGITISKDTGIGYTKITGDSIGFYQNIDQYAPGQNINGRYFNGEIFNATSTMNATSSIALSNAAGNAAMTLNGHTLSNTANNLTYDGNPIYTGKRGDVAAWAEFPANTTVNANGNDVRNVNGLYANGIQAGGATIDNIANIVTNTQTGTVNILTKDGTSGRFEPGTLNVGFSGGNPASTQPNINLKGNAVNIAAGDPLSPTYAAGRTINIDAYAGASAQLLPPFSNANSYINITSHGNSVGAIPVFGRGTGNITLRAYNAYNGLVPDPFSPGTITLDASIVQIGNPTYTGVGTSAIVNMQGAIVQTIAGLQLAGEPGLPAYQIRSAGGVTIYNDPTGYSNRDSRLYVRDIFGHSNFVSDFGPPALTLDGLSGGLTLNNFIEANGQGDGADLNNIATMSGAYPTNVQNQINALQTAIGNISTTGGTSSLSLWFQYPALSTITLNKDLNMAGATASISSLQGVIFNNTSGTLTNTYQKRVYIDGKTSGLASSMMYFDSNAVSFINPSTLSYNNLRGQGFYFGAGTSNLLTVSSGVLQFNGQNLISTSGSGGGSIVSSFTNGISIGPNNLQIQQGAINAPLLYGSDSNGDNVGWLAQPLWSGDASSAYLRYSSTNIDGVLPNGTTSQNFLIADISKYGTANSAFALNNISTLNGIPISSFLAGGSVSTLQNWSYFPVASNAIQFGNQTAWIKGSQNALFTSSDGLNTIPILAQAFTVYDPNNVGVIRNIGFDASGVLTVQRSSTHPSDLRVSSIILNTSPLTTDGTDLYLNGSNIGSSNVASWADYVASSTIRGANITLSNSGVSLAMFDTTTPDPRSTSIFFSPTQLQMANRRGTGQNLFAMTNQSNNFQIYNRAQDGATIQTGGNVQNLRIVADTQLDFGYTFTSPSTLTQGLGVSSISINGSNNLTASNGALYFNGSVVNASNTADIWATFPASSDVNMNSNQMSNITIMKSQNYNNTLQPGFILDQTLGGVINGSLGLFVRNSADSYDSNVITTTNGNIEAQSGPTIPHFVVSSNGFAHQAPNGTSWFRTKVDGTSGQMTIAKMAATTPIPLSTATVYDTIYNPLPTYPITYCTTPGVVRTNLYSPAFGGQVLIQMGTFTPTTKQGIVSFEVIVPAAMSNTQAWIGCGPSASANYDDQHAVLLPPKDPYSGGYWNTITIFCDFTGWIGSNFIFRMDAAAAGQMTFRNVQYKPLPN